MSHPLPKSIIFVDRLARHLYPPFFKRALWFNSDVIMNIGNLPHQYHWIFNCQSYPSDPILTLSEASVVQQMLGYA